MLALRRERQGMTGAPLRIELGWPAKQLSPNSSVHHMTLHRFKKAAKTEAGWATKLAIQSNRDWEPSAEKVKVHLLAHPPEAWRTGDADNLVARIKAHLDGIARALGVNDRIFDAPTVTWADRTPNGKLIVELS
jgi:crossover junction endodeoxyribonuclease RusA